MNPKIYDLQTKLTKKYFQRGYSSNPFKLSPRVFIFYVKYNKKLNFDGSAQGKTSVSVII
jgi:hypothetical protein